jgi:PAS domain S-box-containing protein
MYASTQLANDVLSSAVAAALTGPDALRAALEALPAPIYVTDPDGVVTYFNAACVVFSGRQPTAGKDRWCVTWKLYTEKGELLPHDECPMAVAIKHRRSVRGVTAVAERPDGTRVTFVPFPTPIHDPDGALLGAVNMLVDITELRQIADLRDQAARARRLARGVNDRVTIKTLTAMADEYEAEAASLEKIAPATFVCLA